MKAIENSSLLKLTRIISCLLVPALLSACTLTQSEGAENGVLTPVPFNRVTLQDSFWQPRLETQYETLVPFALEKTKPAVENLRRAAAYRRGEEVDPPTPPRYVSSDLYKVMEGVAYILMEHRDPTLEKRMDEIIGIIAEAQREDGYLYVPHLMEVAGDTSGPWANANIGEREYENVRQSHELYMMGHMYEAAIAYYRATGKERWLEISEKSAKHINRVFFEGDPAYNGGEPVNQAPGHQEIELALTKLYRVTDKELYLEMARKFLDIRGVTYQPPGESGISAPAYSQQHAPVSEQKEAVGHAVRASYMYSAMAAVGAVTGDETFNRALDNIWHNIVDTKMHITGGLGATHGIEGFGPKYVLPNKDTYNETCAAVGNVFFNFRMFLNSGDARYLDVAEVALLNNALAGVNLDGNRFFYVNPLEADGHTEFNHGEAGRSPWFNTACCPSNIARLMPQVPGLMYAHTADEIYATFYGSSSTRIPLKEGPVNIGQQADYPFEGDIRLQVNPAEEQEFTLKLRIPTWARGGQFVPGELYSYTDSARDSWQISVNGEVTEVPLENGFATIERTWKTNDEVELHLPMEPRFNSAVDSVENNRNRVSVTRGPLVFAAEEVDNGVQIQQLYLDTIPEPSAVSMGRFEEGKLQGVVNLKLPAKRLDDGGQSTDFEMTLVPYYAWNNRGNGSMMVWFPAKRN